MKKIVLALGLCGISTALFLMAQVPSKALDEAVKNAKKATQEFISFTARKTPYIQAHPKDAEAKAAYIAEKQKLSENLKEANEKVAQLALAQQKKAPEAAISFGDIDYKQIGEILKQVPALTNLLRNLGQNDIANKMDYVVQPIAKVGDLLTDMTIFEKHVNQIVKSSKDLSRRTVCIKGSKEARAKSKDNICKNLSCLESAPCVVAALVDVENILTPFINDILLGYDDNKGNKKQGLAFIALDIAQQQQYKQQLESLAHTIEQILEFISELKKIIKQG